VGFSTKGRVDAQIFTHTGNNSEELVFGVGNAQRDNKMESTDPEIQNHVYI
jgi:hypothetical protein